MRYLKLKLSVCWWLLFLAFESRVNAQLNNEAMRYVYPLVGGINVGVYISEIVRPFEKVKPIESDERTLVTFRTGFLIGSSYMSIPVGYGVEQKLVNKLSAYTNGMIQLPYAYSEKLQERISMLVDLGVEAGFRLYWFKDPFWEVNNQKSMKGGFYNNLGIRYNYMQGDVNYRTLVDYQEAATNIVAGLGFQARGHFDIQFSAGYRAGHTYTSSYTENQIGTSLYSNRWSASLTLVFTHLLGKDF